MHQLCPRTWVLRAVFLFACSHALAGWLHADGPTRAALEQALAHAAPADRAGLLVRLSTAIEPEDTTRAWDYVQQARQAAQTPADELRADARQAALLRRRGDYPEALTLAKATLVHLDEPGADDPALRGELLLVIAHTHISLASFSSALEVFRTLIPLAESIGDNAFLARVHSTLGNGYADAEQPDRARSAYETALGYAQKTGDQRQIASLLNNLGNVAMETGDAVLARDYHEKALALRATLAGDTRGIADSTQNLGHVALMEGKPADAVPYFDRAIALYRPLGLKRNLTNALTGSVRALTGLGRFEEIPARLEEARRHAVELDSPTILVRVHRAAAEYHEAREDFRSALEAQRELAAATDRAVGEKSRERLDALQARFDAERREHEIDVLRRDQLLQQAELMTVRWQRYSLAVILGVVVALAIAVISRQRLKHRAEARIHAETRAGRDTAEAANALKTRLLGMVSHDIRGPISGMLHLAEEVGQDYPATAADERFQIITHHGRQVLRLAEDLLDAASLEAGKIQLETRRVDLVETVRTALSPFLSAAARKQQVLDFSTPPAPCEIVCDPHRINQIVSNLVSNAVKFSPKKTTIRVAMEHKPGFVRILVSDQGPGISAAKIDSLFMPFTRLAARPTAGESSHGLGLSIAYDLAKLHGGRVFVEPSPGRGATFVVELPAV